MFIKLVHNNSSSNTGQIQADIVTTIKNLLDGTWTSTSDLPTGTFNISQCEVVGSYPLCNDGTTPTFDLIGTGTTTTVSSDASLRFRWRHPDYNASTYQYWSEMWLYYTMTGTYGPRGRVTNRNMSTTYMVPYPSTAYYNYNSTGNAYKYTYQFNAETILIWANKYNVVIHMYNDGYSMIFGTASMEDSPGHQYSYDLTNGNTGPFFSFGSFFGAGSGLTRLGAAAIDNASYDWFWTACPYYTDAQGIARSAPIDAGWSHGNNVSYATYYQTFNPLPYKNVYSTPSAAGRVHQLIPVRVDPHYNHSTLSYPYNGTVQGLYRTTDDIGTFGQQITFNSDNYRVLMMHKTGGSRAASDNIENACYLIPELVDGR